MGYLILAVIVLLVIGCIVTAVLARHHWRWYHITTAILLAIISSLFPFYTAGALKSRRDWNKTYEDMYVQAKSLKVENEQLKYGGEVDGEAGYIDQSLALGRSLMEAGRRWNGLRRIGTAGDQTTLGKIAEPGIDGIPDDAADPAADDGEPPADPPKLIEVGTIVHGFAEQIDPATAGTNPIAVPTFYLGSFVVVSATDTQVVIRPVGSPTPTQRNYLANAQQWSLYEILPLDSHQAFLAEGSKPTDNNILGRIDEEAVRAKLGNRVLPATLKAYLEDGRRWTAEDPESTKWVQIELTKDYTLDVDDPKLNAPIESGTFFDGTGRAVDAKLKAGNEKGEVTFEAGDTLLLLDEPAQKLIAEGKAKLLDQFYFRPLNDYRYILRTTQLRIIELASRIEELQFEGKVLQSAIDETNGLIVIEQERKQKLEQDLAQHRIEGEAIAKYTAEMRQDLDQLKSDISTLFRDNIALEERLDALHNRVNAQYTGL